MCQTRKLLLDDAASRKLVWLVLLAPCSSLLRKAMLTIRTAQVRQLAQEIRKPFVRAQAARLRKVFPKETASLDEQLLVLRIDCAIERAANYGVVLEQDVELFLDCTLMLSPELDTDRLFSWAGNILDRRDLEGTGKMSMIHDQLLFAGF